MHNFQRQKKEKRKVVVLRCTRAVGGLAIAPQVAQWEEGGGFESDLEHNGQVPCNGALR